MNKLSVMLWGCAAFGAGGNAWLALRADGAIVATPAPEAAGDCVEARRTVARSCDRELMECSGIADGCAALVEECRHEGVAEQELDERFAHGLRDPGSDARVRGLLSDALDDVEDTTWSLTCRDAICEVVLEGDVDDAAIAMEGALRPIMKSASFLSRPADDERAAGLSVYVELHPPDRIFAMPLLEDLQRRFEASGALDECHARHGGAGTFNVRIDLDPDDGPIVHVGGSLGATPTGECLIDHLYEALERTKVPAQHTGATRFLRYELPREPADKEGG